MSILQILLELPARVHGLNWQLIFSTETHGFSLNQLYRRGMEVDQDSPALLVVKDIEQNVSRPRDSSARELNLLPMLRYSVLTYPNN